MVGHFRVGWELWTGLELAQDPWQTESLSKGQSECQFVPPRLDPGVLDSFGTNRWPTRAEVESLLALGR